MSVNGRVNATASRLRPQEDNTTDNAQQGTRARAVKDNDPGRVGPAMNAIYDAMAKERQKRKPADAVPATLPEQKCDARVEKELAGLAARG